MGDNSGRGSFVFTGEEKKEQSRRGPMRRRFSQSCGWKTRAAFLTIDMGGKNGGTLLPSEGKKGSWDGEMNGTPPKIRRFLNPYRWTLYQSVAHERSEFLP